MNPLSTIREFASLSLHDLLEARELFHVHLMKKRNVVATAVGRHLFRTGDPPPKKDAWRGGVATESGEPPAPKTPRRLDDTEVRRYSWPCVLVFVTRWHDATDFGQGELQTSDFIPPSIYLPDGREVPICVVESPLVERVEVAPTDLAFPQNLLGGGFPVITDVQEEIHIASIGCMVTDGHKAYALTNRHVAGDPGETVYGLLDGKQIPVGKSSKLQLTRRPFEQVYPGWPGHHVHVNMDVGLIEVFDKNQWTAQVYGIGAIGPMVDLSVLNMTLNLIGCPVRAYGCASRHMFGQIEALFYQYKSAGGFEYVADFLIGPSADRTKPFFTGPGDSGTLWLAEGEAEGKPELSPIALEWGGQVFGGSNSSQSYALATCLSTVCNALNVDLVQDWNTGHPEYWGAVGHYTIAAKAIEALPAGPLKDLMKANLPNITYDAQHISAREMAGLSKRHFVPLADVPDYVWKMGPKRNAERPNHFADMDKPDSQHQTLLQLCQNKPQNVNVAVWQKYYSDVKDSERGLLPFRVWQFFQAMLGFVSKGDVERFVCAAGILSHYVGDACQPLHISYMFNGIPPNGKGAVVGDGVHAAYEDLMVNTYTLDLLQNVNGNARGIKPFEALSDGHSAGVMTVGLMQRTFAALQPEEIAKTYASLQSKPKKEQADSLWREFGKATIAVMSNGAQALAHIWQEAWRIGKGNDTLRGKSGAIDVEKLIAIYKGEYLAGKFLTSYTLNQIGPVLKSSDGTKDVPQPDPGKKRGKGGTKPVPKPGSHPKK